MGTHRAGTGSVPPAGSPQGPQTPEELLFFPGAQPGPWGGAFYRDFAWVLGWGWGFRLRGPCPTWGQAAVLELWEGNVWEMGGVEREGARGLRKPCPSLLSLCWVGMLSVSAAGVMDGSLPRGSKEQWRGLTSAPGVERTDSTAAGQGTQS